MSAPALTKTLRLLGDERRLRLLHLVSHAELAVGELAAILGASQPLVSAQVAQLRAGGLLELRRAGRRTLVRPAAALPELARVAVLAFGKTPEARRDVTAAKDAVAARERATVSAGLGLRAEPGRSWEAFAHGLLALLPQMRIADVGPGSGGMALLFARVGHHVIAIDGNAAALTRLQARAKREGLGARIACRRGEASKLPLAVGEVDCVLMSQLLHELERPEDALRSARSVLAKGGRVLVLDLEAHGETWVREQFGHRHLGFRKAALRDMLRRAGFAEVDVRSSGRDPHAPHFEGLVGTGVRTR